jgi:hypothetical protein
MRVTAVRLSDNLVARRFRRKRLLRQVEIDAAVPHGKIRDELAGWGKQCFAT